MTGGHKISFLTHQTWSIILIMLLWFAAGAVIVSVGAMSSGCAGVNKTFVQRQQVIAEIAVKFATGRFLERNPDMVDGVGSVVDSARAAIAAGDLATVGALEAVVFQLIPWDDLGPGEASLVRQLVAAVRAEIEIQLSRAGVDDPATVQFYLDVVLGWIAEEVQFWMSLP